MRSEKPGSQAVAARSCGQDARPTPSGCPPSAPSPCLSPPLRTSAVASLLRFDDSPFDDSRSLRLSAPSAVQFPLSSLSRPFRPVPGRFPGRRRSFRQRQRRFRRSRRRFRQRQRRFRRVQPRFRQRQRSFQQRRRSFRRGRRRFPGARRSFPGGRRRFPGRWRSFPGRRRRRGRASSGRSGRFF
jgi:hypothetical protein